MELFWWNFFLVRELLNKLFQIIYISSKNFQEVRRGDEAGIQKLKYIGYELKWKIVFTWVGG